VIGEGVVGGLSEKGVLERKRKSLKEGKGQLKKKTQHKNKNKKLFLCVIIFYIEKCCIFLLIG
jgi:hypothetical protein